MLPTEFLVLAVCLRLLAGVSYVTALLKGRVRPNLVSWFFWGLTALIAFVLELFHGGGSRAFVTLAVGIGPVIVFVIALAKGLHKNRFTAVDKYCAALTAFGLVLWLLTKNPLLALITSIVVDFVSGIPTIVKTYHHPHTEKALPYALSSAAMAVTLLTIHDWQPMVWLFPAYILWTNFNFVVLSAGRIGPRLKRRAARRQQVRLIEEADAI